MALIIAFGHKAKTGKDAAVKAIIEARGKDIDIRRYSFADAMKNEVTQSIAPFGSVAAFIQHLQIEEERKFSAPDGYSANPLIMELDPNEPLDYTDPLCPYGKHRGLLQFWGGDYRRGQNPFYWVDKVDRKILDENPTVALISDMRYRNEALMVKHYNGFTVRMERQNNPGLQGSHASHVSETELDKWVYDFQIVSEKDDLGVLRQDAVEIFDIIADVIDVHRGEDFNFALCDTDVCGHVAA